MKKTVWVALTFFCFGIFAGAQEIPVYDGKNADVALLVDIKAHKGVKDNLVLVNMANPDGMIFNVFVYEKNAWRNFGNGVLNYLHDKDKVSTNLEKDFGKYAYAAIVPLDGKQYTYEIRAKNNDLHLFVLPENPSYSAFASNATEIDISSFQKKVKDNIRLVSNSATVCNTGFFIFADDGSGFKLVVVAYLNGIDTCFAEGFDLDLKNKKYSRYAVSASDGKKYKYIAQARNNDLYIYVED